MVAHAGGDHRHRRSESRLLDEFGQFVEGDADEAVLDLGLLGGLVPDLGLHHRVELLLLDLHVQAQPGVELLERAPPLRSGLGMVEILQQCVGFAVVTLQDGDRVVHGSSSWGFGSPTHNRRSGTLGGRAASGRMGR